MFTSTIHGIITQGQDERMRRDARLASSGLPIHRHSLRFKYMSREALGLGSSRDKHGVKDKKKGKRKGKKGKKDDDEEEDAEVVEPDEDTDDVIVVSITAAHVRPCWLAAKPIQWVYKRSTHTHLLLAFTCHMSHTHAPPSVCQGA